MQARMTVRYRSGRDEQFEVEIAGGQLGRRLKEFVNEPALVLRTGKEVIIIPSTAIESVALLLPEWPAEEISLEGVRKATRVQ